jgi:hypothetical protein
MFYTDIGSNARVVRTNLDGSDPYVIKSNLVNPNGVVFDGTNVYVIDSNYGSDEQGALYKTDIDGTFWQKITGLDELKVCIE